MCVGRGGGTEVGTDVRPEWSAFPGPEIHLCSVENLGILCALTSLYRGQKYKRSPFRAAHIYEWDGSLDFSTPSPYQNPWPLTPLPPPPHARSVPSCAFLSFCLSFFLYVLTSVEDSVPVCCTVQFMTTTCFQAILQTAID